MHGRVDLAERFRHVGVCVVGCFEPWLITERRERDATELGRHLERLELDENFWEARCLEYVAVVFWTGDGCGWSA